MTMLIGHDVPIATFLAAANGDRLHHAWLFAGPEGIGKRAVAFECATFLLAQALDPNLPGLDLTVAENSPVARFMAAGSHPDFRFLRRLPKDEKLREKPPADWPDAVELSRNIRVDQIRRLTNSFATKPSLSTRRVVIIDSVDELERSASNALLKTLEEPPFGTIFLLISHSPGRLLPTIRSRCRPLRFSALADDEMVSILRGRFADLAHEEVTAITAAAQGSPSRAINLATLDVATLSKALEDLFYTGDPYNHVRATLAKSLAAKSAHARFEAFIALVPAFIAAKAKTLNGTDLAVAIDHWSAARHLIQSASHASLETQAVVFALAGHVAALAPRTGAVKA
jgi:DNA polymerase III subunit delta'